MKKSSPTPFDFRRLMNKEELPQIAPLPDQKITVGAAVSEHGLVLVVLQEGGLDSLDLKSYPNLVIGPIENDWEKVAPLIDSIRSILEPPEVSNLFLRLDSHKLGDNVVRMQTRLEALFPNELRIVQECEIALWRRKFPSQIALPTVPEPDAWARDLLLAAAETAIYGELAADSLLTSHGRKRSARSQRLANALSVTFPHEQPKKDSKKEEPPKAPQKRPPKCYKSEATAISYSKPHLHLVTVYEDERSHLVIDHSRTRYLSYDGRDSASMRAVQKKLSDLLQQWDIRRIAMRVGLDNGQYRLSTLAYKLEAALQVMPDLELRSWTTTEVMGFGRSSGDYLPSPLQKFARKGDRENQLNAIRTAALELFQREGRI